MHDSARTFLEQYVCEVSGASKVLGTTKVQSLWSDYGGIYRFYLADSAYASVIVKWIDIPTQARHPRGWNTNASQARKIHSYEIETRWYQGYATLCPSDARVPICLAAEFSEKRKILILEDLDAAGFPARRQALTKEGLTACLEWLATFHATFFASTIDDLWPTGTYWHLATRQDELLAMPDNALRKTAKTIDMALSSSPYQSLVHGDAKVANFCFDAEESCVAAVDFQYVGKGVGIKDVAYFLGSCLDDEALFADEKWALEVYFSQLRQHMSLTQKADVIEARFLEGWHPGHRKLNAYTHYHVDKVLAEL